MSKVRYSRNKPNASRMNTTSRESVSKTDERIDKLADQVSTLVEIVSKKVVTPAPVKAVEETWRGPSIPTNPSLKKVVERETEETRDKEQSNFQGITAQIPPSVTPISILEPNVPKTLPKTTPILEPDVPKNLPKPNIPYPSRLNQEKIHEKASFAPTIRNLLMNKEKLLELAKIPLNENCSTMLLKKLPENIEIRQKNDKLPVIIAKGLKDDEKDTLLKVLKSHKRAIAWKITDIKGIDPRFCTHKILMEDDYKPTVQSQRRVNPKIHKVIKKEVLKLLDADYGSVLDDFLVFGDSFDSCLSNLEKMLKRCEDTNLILNWEKCHFMCREGIVLGHKISKSGIEVDRAKVDVIAKLPHPTTVKGVRSFLGHAGFYRCFIQDFSKIARPMTHLLEKETPFVFFKDCIDAFQTLKKKLTEAPILV
ncbi:hypothetical protein Tco_0771058 [Tanacetum coccineum]|uniref:Reverse transcriptase domain-containing protein n=1 Tax=Tanacetum coccineum TaxID=301880 RepID=A0ABQ4ZHH6_9ASTR